jgi:hypothetical protein
MFLGQNFRVSEDYPREPLPTLEFNVFGDWIELNLRVDADGELALSYCDTRRTRLVQRSFRLRWLGALLRYGYADSMAQERDRWEIRRENLEMNWVSPRLLLEL